MPPKKEISLLPQEENSQSPLARFLRWATGVGRVVIVFTELIVILAFLSRFWLDRENADLSETLRQQKAIITSTKEFEKDYLSLQERLNYIDKFYKNTPDFTRYIRSLVNTVPNDIFFQSLSFKKQPEKSDLSCLAQLYSYQESSLINFITNASLNPDIKSIDVRRIEKKSRDNKYYLDVVISFKQSEA